jgi:hypothetical protein
MAAVAMRRYRTGGRRSRRPHPSRPPLLLSWRGRLRLLHPIPLARHTPQSSPLPSKDRCYPDVATAKGVEQNIRSKTSSPPLHSRSKRTPVPETRPTTIEGWMLREVLTTQSIVEHIARMR